MKKIIYIGLTAIMLVTLVYALSYGDVITQEQLDATNIDSLNLKFGWESSGIVDGFSIYNNVIYREYHTDFLQSQGENYTYIQISRKQKILSYDLWDDCRTIYSYTECLDYFKRTSNIQSVKTVQEIKDRLKRLQTPSPVGLS